MFASEFECESKYRPTPSGVEEKAVLVVGHVQMAISEDECVPFAEVFTHDAQELICEIGSASSDISVSGGVLRWR